jgi:hypothetical protein
MAVQQHEERVGFLSLLEHRRVLGKPDRAGLAQDRIEVRGGKAGEQWQMGNERTVDLGHGGPSVPEHRPRLPATIKPGLALV